MTNAKRILPSILLASLFAFTVSCKKSSDDAVTPPEVEMAESTMTFKLDGTAKTYTDCVAVGQTMDDISGLSITGSVLTVDDDFLSVYVGSKTAVATGYSANKVFFDGGSKIQATIGLAKTGVNYTTVFTTDLSKMAIEVHITERTATNVKGTFSGKVYSEDQDDTKAYVVSEGKFNAKMIQD